MTQTDDMAGSPPETKRSDQLAVENAATDDLIERRLLKYPAFMKHDGDDKWTLMGPPNPLCCEAADKIKRQQTALQTAKSYIDSQPSNETTANVLAIINGVLDSDEYVP